jgi:hypothetical protein
MIPTTSGQIRSNPSYALKIPSIQRVAWGIAALQYLEGYANSVDDLRQFCRIPATALLLLAEDSLLSRTFNEKRSRR